MRCIFGEKMNASRKKSILLIIFITLLLGALAFFAVRIVSKNETALRKTPQTEEIVKNDHAISVPGYESVTFKAGEIRQNAVFYNPAQNNCYFRISLELSDGTLLWQSDLIPPGMQTEKIDLLFPLEAGTYSECVLVYDSYADKDAAEALNGAKTVLTVYAR